jgi:tetratricopeptide (TPR) repeat protein
MKVFVAAVILSISIGPAWPGSDYPVDQDAIHDEIVRIQDGTGEINKKDWTRARKLFDKGIAAHDRLDYERAIEFYTRAIEIAPIWANAYYERALSAMSLGRATEALEDIVRTLSLDPKHSQAMVTRGSLEDDLGHEDRALATYSALLELEPDHYLGLVNMAITYLNSGEYEKADELLIRATEAKPDQPSAYIHLANSARIRGYNYDEESYLERYLEIGEGDPRYEPARMRYDELNSEEARLDPGAAYPEIEMAVALSRALWKSQTHRERNPDARGYQLTLEEDKEVLQDLLLGMWRTKKSEDPMAQHEYYDFLLAIDDAGFFDEYVYTQKADRLGPEAAAWREAHPERVEAFFAWAREAGYASDDEETEEATAETEDGEDEVEVTLGDLPGLVLQVAEESDWTYELTLDEAVDGPTDAEIRRWRKYRYEGEDVVDCKIDVLEAMQESVGSDFRVFLRAARCLSPEDPEWSDLEAVRRLGRRFDDVSFELAAAVEVVGKHEVRLSVADERSLFYGFAKATLPREPLLRRVFDAESVASPHPVEEWAALLTAIGAYRNGLEPDEETGETGQPDPYMERLSAVHAAELLEAFVAYEIVHKQYGVSLERLPRDLADELDDYLTQYVFPVVDAGG